MKKIALIVCALCLTLNEVCAQKFVSDSTNGTPDVKKVEGQSADGSESSEGYKDAFDLMWDINPDTDYHSLGLGWDTGNVGYFTLGTGFGGPEGVDMFALSVGWGFRKRHVINDIFLIQGKLYPYAGYSSMELDLGDSTVSEKEFAWGLQGNLSIGLKLWNTSAGNSVFLTGGYSDAAPELDFGKIGDNGYWGLGITVIYN